MRIKQYTLNNGMTMPCFGLGTYRLTPDQAELSVKTALECGYRLIDTANIYMNEKAVGRGIKASGVDREEIFLVSKIWPTEYRYADCRKAIDETLERLDTDYIDLLLLHQDCGHYKEAWKALEDAVKAGKVKSIGLSNFNEKEIDEILSIATIKPVVDQVECHIRHNRKKFKEFLDSRKMILMSWYPLANADKTFFEDRYLLKLSGKYHCTPAQIMILWQVQSGNICIPGSKNPEHIKANIAALDYFTLTSEEIKNINEDYNKNKLYFNMPHFLRNIMFTSGHKDYNSQK